MIRMRRVAILGVAVLICSALTACQSERSTDTALPTPTPVAPLHVDDSRLLVRTAATAYTDPTIEGRRLLAIIHSQAPGHRTAAEQAFLDSGVSLTDGGLPATVVLNGSPASVPAFLPAAVVVSTDSAAAHETVAPLNGVVEMISALMGHGKRSAALDADARQLIRADLAVGTARADVFRRTLISLDNNGQSMSLDTALRTGAQFDLTYLQLSLITAVMTSAAYVLLAKRTGAQFKSKNSGSGHIHLVADDSASAWGSAGCALDVLPASFFTGTAAASGGALTFVKESMAEAAKAGGAAEWIGGASFLIALIGLFSDFLALMLNMLTFQAFIKQDTKVVRTKSTNTTGSTNHVTAKFEINPEGGEQSGALECMLRMASLLGVDASTSPLSKADLKDATAKLTEIGDDDTADTPAFFGNDAKDLKVDQNGEIEARLSGTSQKQDMSEIHTEITRKNKVRATVYPSTAGGRSRVEALLDATAGVAITVATGAFETAEDGEIGPAIAGVDAVVKVASAAFDAGGWYNQVGILPLTDWDDWPTSIDLHVQADCAALQYDACGTPTSHFTRSTCNHAVCTFTADDVEGHPLEAIGPCSFNDIYVTSQHTPFFAKPPVDGTITLTRGAGSKPSTLHLAWYLGGDVKNYFSKLETALQNAGYGYLCAGGGYYMFLEGQTDYPRLSKQLTMTTRGDQAYTLTHDQLLFHFK